MDFVGVPTLEVESGTFHLVLDEIFPWLASYEKLADELKDIEQFTGLADLSVKNIRGPLMEPSRLQYELLGSLENVTLTTTRLPGPLKIESCDVNILPDRITFENLQANLLDSSLTSAGVLQNLINGTTNAEIIVTDAEIGAEVNAWLIKQAELPKVYQFKTPLLISRAQTKWTRDELLDLQGDFSINSGPVFSIDFLLHPDELVLRNLAIMNGEDKAVLRLNLQKKKVGAEFKGSLAQSTINRIMLHNDYFPNAWIKGDISFHIDMDTPADSAASGSLDGGHFVFPLNLDTPLLLDSFSLAASERTLAVKSAEALFEGGKYSISGTASLAGKRLAMNFDAMTDAVDLNKILAALNRKAEKGKTEKKQRVGKDWDLAMTGSINFKADSLLYNGFTWKPFDALITFANSSLGIEVVEADLCSIATPGKILYHDGQISLDFTMAAEDKEFKDVLVCLEGGEQQMTGTLDLHATIKGQGTRDTLVNSLAGNLQYSSKDGYIYQDARAAKLLYVLNVTNMFEGKIPDLATRGFHYDSLIVRGVMENGILTITPARLDAPIMEIAAHGTIDMPREKIDLQVLVAPLQTLNKLQKMLPVISKIIPESLVAVPVEVKGDFDDIKVKTLSMSAISRNAFGTMVDALTTPMRVLEKNPEEVK